MTAPYSVSGRTSIEIVRSVERAMRTGHLTAGAALPTVRALAGELAVSPTTVAAAYRALRQRGLITTRGRRGTVVGSTVPPIARAPVPVPAGARNLAHGNPDPALLPPFGPALRVIDASHHLYGEALKNEELLQLARRDLANDSIQADALAVVCGAMDGIERVLSAHLRIGDRVAVEDPGFTSVIDLVNARGLTPVPVAIDDSGLLPDALEAVLRAGVDAIVATPRAQNPTGAALDEPRAKELRRLLRTHPDVLLIEDDHGAGVAGSPAYTLRDKALTRWAFVRSLSKSLGPDLRIAILAGDAETVARVESRQLIGIRWVSQLLQRLAARLWSDRSTPALLRRAERTYRKRREALCGALAGRAIAAHGRSGLNVWIPVPEEASVVQKLLASGWAVAAGERFRLASRPAIRATISTLEPADAERFADALARVLRGGGRTGSV